MLKLFFLPLVILWYFGGLSAIAGGGGWVGGGGELIRDAHNPWFINSTSEVHYCIISDEKNFGIDTQTFDIQLHRALGYWQSEFKQAVRPSINDHQELLVGLQPFIQVPCDKNPDIRFQLGVLDSKQIEFLENPQRYGAISVRTEYDSVTMKGRGFIYFSPQIGPNAFTSHLNITDFWERKEHQYLYLTLVHELGHVFGLEHKGSTGEMMSAGFLESLLLDVNSPTSMPSNFQSNYYSLRSDIPTLCFPPQVLSTWQGFFKFEKNHQCFRLEFTHNQASHIWKSSYLKIWSGPDEKRTTNLIAEGSLNMVRFFPTHTTLLALPDGQTVISPPQKLLITSNFMAGIPFIKITKQGFLLQPGSKRRISIEVSFEQGSPQIEIIAADFKGHILHLL